MKKRSNTGQVILHILLIIAVLLSIFPFLYMVSTAMTEDTFTMPYPPIIVPEKLYFGNFV